MNLSAWAPPDLAAVRAFYDAGQTWSFSAIMTGQSPTAVELGRWLEEAPLPRQHPLVLPVLRTGHSDPRWYAIAFSDAQAERLRLELNAFLGPAGSDYSGRRAVLDPDDPLEAVVQLWAGGANVFRFTSLPGARGQVRTALERMRQVWTLRPAKTAAAVRTTDGLLREFFTALANRDPAASQRWLDEIRQSGRLSAENFRFLEIERLAAHGYWDQISLHPQLAQLAAIRRPRRITGLLIEALWRSEIAPLLAQGQPAEAIAYMREKFLPRYEGLLRSRGALRQPLVILTFLLAAVAGSPTRREAVPELLGELDPESPERSLAETLIAQLPSTVDRPTRPDDPLVRAKQALGEGNYDSTWMWVQRASLSEEAVAIQLECAEELSTPETARVALDRLAALPAPVREQLLRRKRWQLVQTKLARLVAEARVPSVQDWESWLAALGRDPAWPQALDSARSARAEWVLQPYRDDPARVERLAQLLEQQAAQPSQILRWALPHLAAFFLETPAAAFAPIYQKILLVLALDDQFGSEDWTLAQNLATAILESGPDRQAFAETLESLTAIWSERGDVGHLDWALDQLDFLAAGPRLNPEAIEKFYASVRQTIVSRARRISRPQYELFRLLCGDLGHEADAQALQATSTTVAPSEVSAGVALAGKLVGIYTLTEGAAAHAKTVIERQFPGVEVRLNHDHGGSPRLGSLAHEADYFLLVAKSAKHAATDFIKQRRPRNKSELIYPLGRGSSSIVTALLRVVGFEN